MAKLSAVRGSLKEGYASGNRRMGRAALRVGLVGLSLLAILGLPSIGFSEDALPEVADHVVRGILSEAGEVPVGTLHQVQADMDAGKTVASLPALLLGAGMAEGSELSQDDFRVWPGADWRLALYPAVKDRPGPRTHYRYARPSLFHPEYIQRVTWRRVGQTFSGSATFASPAYDGTLLWTAKLDQGRWLVHSIRFPASNITYERVGPSKWRRAGAKKKPNLAAASDVPASTRALVAQLQDMDLPRLPALGIFPEPGKTLFLKMSADGGVRISGKLLAPAAIRKHLLEQMRRKGKASTPPYDHWELVLAVPRTVPWRALALVLQSVCVHPDVQIARIRFPARIAQSGPGSSIGNGPMGVIGLDLPVDRGLTPGRPREFIKSKARIFPAGDKPASGPDWPHLLEAALTRARAGEDVPEVFEIVCPPPGDRAVPAQAILHAMAAAYRAGFRETTVEGSAVGMAPGIDANPATVQRTLAAMPKPAALGALRVRVDRGDILSGSVKGPIRALVSNKPVTLAAPNIGLMIEEMEEEIIDEEIEEAPMGEEPVIRDEEIEEETEEMEGGKPFKEWEETEGLEDAPFEGPARNAASKAHAARAIKSALEWLKAHQNPDGSWSARRWNLVCNFKPVTERRVAAQHGVDSFDVGVTGLALSAFLGSGYTNRGHHPYKVTIQKGLRYLRNIQDPEGCFGPRRGPQWIYNHALASLAMIEAYGMTESPIFKGAAQRALDFHAVARNPYFAWRYGIKPGDNDTSVTAWMSMALLSAELVNASAVKRGRQAPLKIDPQWKAGVGAWFGKMTDEYGRVGYITRGSSSARTKEKVGLFPPDSVEALTAAANYIRDVGEIGDPKTRKSDIARGLALVQRALPKWNQKINSVDMPYWFFGSSFLSRVAPKQEASELWLEAMRRQVLQNQRKTGHLCGVLGSWDPAGAWGDVGGRVYSTSLMVMSLQSAWRVPLPHRSR